MLKVLSHVAVIITIAASKQSLCRCIRHFVGGRAILRYWDGIKILAIKYDTIIMPASSPDEISMNISSLL